MKRRIAVTWCLGAIMMALAVLLLCGTVGAWMNSMVAGQGVSAQACADTSCTGFLVCQNFEGTGYDNSESWTESCGTGATCDEDSTATVLRGSQSYAFTNGTGNSSVYVAYTASDEVYTFFEYQFATDANHEVFRISDGNTTRFSMSYGATNNKFYSGAAECNVSLSINTPYYVWARYKKGTGADEIDQVWVSTTITKPASPCIDISNGADTTTVSRVYLYNSASSTSSIFDHVLVKTTEISDVCD